MRGRLLGAGVLLLLLLRNVLSVPMRHQPRLCRPDSLHRPVVSAAANIARQSLET